MIESPSNRSDIFLGVTVVLVPGYPLSNGQLSLEALGSTLKQQGVDVHVAAAESPTPLDMAAGQLVPKLMRIYVSL